MNGPALIGIALALLVALRALGKAPLAVPALFAFGMCGFLGGFWFGIWPLAIAGLIAMGAGSYFHERRRWVSYRGASERLENRRAK